MRRRKKTEGRKEKKNRLCPISAAYFSFIIHELPEKLASRCKDKQANTGRYLNNARKQRCVCSETPEGAGRSQGGLTLFLPRTAHIFTSFDLHVSRCMEGGEETSSTRIYNAECININVYKYNSISFNVRKSQWQKRYGPKQIDIPYMHIYIYG